MRFSWKQGKRGLRVTLEVKLQDLWVGGYWKHTRIGPANLQYTDLWICFVPMLPIHVMYARSIVDSEPSYSA